MSGLSDTLSALVAFLVVSQCIALLGLAVTGLWLANRTDDEGPEE